MAHKRLVEQSGPNGGTQCELTFFNSDMLAVDESEATQSILTEFDAHDEEVARTYVAIHPEQDDEGEQEIEGGLADDMSPSDFNPEQLEAGIEVELEHTDSHSIAQEIAMDHLSEDPNYYKKLEKAGL